MNDVVKLRRMSINEKSNVFMSVTPVGNDRYVLFDERSGIIFGEYGKKYLLSKKVFSQSQLDAIKGTTNFKRVG